MATSDFDVQKYLQDKITVKRLDEMMDFVMQTGAGKIAAIIAGIKILVCFAYLYTRSKLVEAEQVVAEQIAKNELIKQHDADNEVV